MPKHVLCCLIPAMLLLSGCEDKPPSDRPLMATPVLYQAGVDPFEQVPPERRRSSINLFYATDRAADPNAAFGYGADPSDVLSLGQCTVEIVPETRSWLHLSQLSLKPDRTDDLALKLGPVKPEAQIRIASDRSAAHDLDPATQRFIDQLNADIRLHPDKMLNIYVHGATMDFDDAMTLAAEFHHFTGRRATWIAFAWPAHPHVYQYALGEDGPRINQSSVHFAQLLELLGQHSDAPAVNIICWSAGSRIVSDALMLLHQRHPDLSPDEIGRFCRLGDIVFCASDESFGDFLTKMKTCHGMLQSITYTVSDGDILLELSSLIHDDAQRVGEADSDDTSALATAIQAMNNITVLDVSYQKEQRGFDITGHRYWFRNPWVSSDIILDLLTDWPANRRGLDPTSHPQVWGMTDRYPGRVQQAASRFFESKPATTASSP